MKVKDLLDWGCKYLKKFKLSESVAFLVLKYVDTTASMYISNNDVPIKKEKIYKDAIIAYCEKDLPVSLFFGYTYFYNLKIFVNHNCFLPRFETEQLVDETCHYLKSKAIYINRVIDLCCGIGPIAICMKKEFPNAIVKGIDINEKAINTAKKSAKNLSLSIEFETKKMELFVPSQKFDLIIMNPPYISRNDYVEKSVLKIDPRISLYGEENGYYFYKQLARNIKNIATRDFVLALEIGAKQAKQVLGIMKEAFKINDSKIIKDYQNFDRIIIIRGKIENVI